MSLVNPVDAIKTRIRTDLRSAMSARAMDEIKVLRTLLAALDNAEAVPVAPERYTERQFGDPSSEVARKQLSAEDIAAILQAEQREMLAAAETLAHAGRGDDAAKLTAEAAIVARYLEKA